MTTSNCTASSAVSGSTTYPTLLTNTAPYSVAEDSGEYTTKPASDAAFAKTLKRLDVQSTGKTLSGQITRLYGLVSLLLPNEQPTDRTGGELRLLAIELEQTAEIIEGKVNVLLDAVVDESEK